MNVNLRCNGKKGCDDGSDELMSLCTPPCSTDQFACADGSKCIPKSYLCDDSDDCDDGSDEYGSLCTPPCSTDQFACADGSKCFHIFLKCNGKVDCEDGLDDLGYLLWSALVYIDLPWSAWAVSDHHRKA